jgi:hypothetical protein
LVPKVLIQTQGWLSETKNAPRIKPGRVFLLRRAWREDAS